MINFKHILWTIKNLRPSKVKRLFEHIHAFVDYDKEIAGFKYAIYYGRLYFEKSNYNNCMIDLQERSDRVARIIDEYHNPKDRKAYIMQLCELRDGVETANAEGLFSCGNHTDQNKIEAAHYKDAMDCLNILIKACAIYPWLWSRIFLRS